MYLFCSDKYEVPKILRFQIPMNVWNNSMFDGLNYKKKYKMLEESEIITERKKFIQAILVSDNNALPGISTQQLEFIYGWDKVTNKTEKRDSKKS